MKTSRGYEWRARGDARLYFPPAIKIVSIRRPGMRSHGGRLTFSFGTVFWRWREAELEEREAVMRPGDGEEAQRVSGTG